jgi:drug/metabolite transporter (DMT)-like permease
MKTNRDAIVGACAVALAYAAWGVGGPMFKRVDTSSSVLRLSWRGQTSVIFTTVPSLYVALRARKTTPGYTSWSAETRKGIASVGVSMFVMFVCWNIGVDETAFSHLAVFSQTHPLFLILYQAFAAARAARRRKASKTTENDEEEQEQDDENLTEVLFPTRGEWIGVAVSFAGVVTTATSKGSASAKTPPTVKGDVISLGCGVAGAFYALAIRRWFGSNGIGIPNASGVFVQACAAVVMTLLSFLTLACTPGQVWYSSAPPFNKGVFDWPRSDDLWPGVVSIGTLAIMGHAFITVAMQKLPLIVVSLCLTLTPVVQTMFAYVFLGDDAPSSQGIAGGCVIILGIAIAMLSDQRGRGG